MNRKLIPILGFFMVCQAAMAQDKAKEEDARPDLPLVAVQEADSLNAYIFQPLTPTKAAFYSAVLPGLGQAYNKKYFWIPIWYAGIGSGVYFYIKNNEDYNRYRDAYKRRLAGFSDDEFWGDGVNPRVSNDGLVRAQKVLSRNKEISLLVAAGAYVLNIINANVQAHLLQYNIDDQLSFQPNLQFDSYDFSASVGVKINLVF